MSKKLEPKACPFCGRQATEDRWDNTNPPRVRHQVRCESGRCAIQPYTTIYSTRRAAVKAWNRRKGR